MELDYFLSWLELNLSLHNHVAIGSIVISLGCVSF